MAKQDLTLRPTQNALEQQARDGRIGYAYNAAGYTQSGIDPQTDNFSHYWHILGRHKWIVLGSAFLGALAGYLITLPQKPVYRAQTALEIQNLNDEFLNMKNLSPTAPTAFQNPEYNIKTQITLLQSKPVLERAFNSLKPEEQRELLDTPGPGRFGALLKTVGMRQPEVASEQEQGMLDAAAKVKVQSELNSRVIMVAFDSTDPQLAANFTNSLATSFIQTNLDKRRQASQDTVEWLLQQMQGVKNKLKTAEQQLQAFAAASNLTVISGDKDNIVAEERLKQLQTDLLKAQSESGSKQSKFEATATAPAESLPEVLDDPTLKEYQVDLTKLRRDLADLSSTYTDQNPKVIKVKAQIAEIESALEKKRGNILSRIRNEYNTAQRYERLLNTNYSAQLGMMAKQANKLSQYADLKREVDTTRALYDGMFQKVTEAGLATAMRASDIRVIEPATAPKAPYKPSIALNTGFGLALGMCFGIALVVQRSRSDRSIQGPGETAFLNVPELGVIPSGASENGKRFLRSSADTAKGNNAERLELMTWQQQRSLLAESFRLTLTSILLSQQDGAHARVLVVSSANPGEGKTTVISNLGIALAQTNQRVLLIDGDLRRPRLHSIFGLDNSAGLGEVLAGKSQLAIQETHIPNLFVLPSGKSEDAGLLFKPELRSLLRRLKAEFSMILIDTPPMLSMPDARLFSRCADAAILVVAQHTSRDAVGMACQKLSEDGSSLLGTILNNWDPKSSMHAYSQALEYYAGYYKHPVA